MLDACLRRSILGEGLGLGGRDTRCRAIHVHEPHMHMHKCMSPAHVCGSCLLIGIRHRGLRLWCSCSKGSAGPKRKTCALWLCNQSTKARSRSVAMLDAARLQRAHSRNAAVSQLHSVLAVPHSLELQPPLLGGALSRAPAALLLLLRLAQLRALLRDHLACLRTERAPWLPGRGGAGQGCRRRCTGGVPRRPLAPRARPAPRGST